MITVAICTYNPREEFISRAVDSIMSQKNCSEFEFFIVDNNSSSAVQELPCVRKYSIKVISETRQGLTAARQCATLNSRGDIVVFVDDDNILSANYLSIVEKAFCNPSIGVISGTVLPEYETQPQRWFLRFEGMLALRSFPARDRLYLTTIPIFNNYFPIGAGMAVRKEILEKYFASLTDETRIEGRKGKCLSSGEDLDLDFFSINQGYAIGVKSDLKVNHIIPANRCTLDYVCRITEQNVKSCNEVNKKWKNIFGQNVFMLFDVTLTMILFHLMVRILFFPFKRARVGFACYRALFPIRCTNIRKSQQYH